MFQPPLCILSLLTPSNQGCNCSFRLKWVLLGLIKGLCTMQSAKIGLFLQILTFVKRNVLNLNNHGNCSCHYFQDNEYICLLARIPCNYFFMFSCYSFRCQHQQLMCYNSTPTLGRLPLIFTTKVCWLQRQDFNFHSSCELQDRARDHYVLTILSSCQHLMIH